MRTSRGMRASGRCVVGLFALLVCTDALAAPELVLRWNSLPEAVEYEVEIAEDESFTIVVASGRTAGTKWAWPVLPDRRHYWRVRCRYEWDRVGPWSPTRVIEAMVGAPVLLHPADAARVVAGTTVEFALEAPPGVVEQVVEIAGDAEFASVVHREPVTSGRAEIASLVPGRFWWRATGVDALGRGVPPSEVRVLTVARPARAPIVIAGPPSFSDEDAAIAPLVAAEAAVPALEEDIAPAPVPPHVPELAAGWIGGGWVRGPRADALLLAQPRGRWRTGISTGWYGRRGRTGNALLSVDVVPLVVVARWSAAEGAWIGGSAGAAVVSTHLSVDGGHVDALHAVPLLAPAAGVERHTSRGALGLQLSWSVVPVAGRVSGDAGGVTLSFSWRPEVSR